MPTNLNLDVIRNAYGFTVSANGEVLGLTSGDMGYESTGIQLDDDTLEIWRLGCAAKDAQVDPA